MSVVYHWVFGWVKRVKIDSPALRSYEVMSLSFELLWFVELIGWLVIGVVVFTLQVEIYFWTMTFVRV